MEEVKDGFGYVGAVTQTNDGEHIQCHVCGYFYHNLGAHVYKRHGIKVREYREKYGLRLREGLLSPRERVRAQIRYNNGARGKNRATVAAKARAIRKKKVESGELKLGGNQWSAQRRNEKGNCKAQTLAKIKNMYDRDGVVTERKFKKEYGGLSTVKYWFGSWNSALKELKIPEYRQRESMNRDERMGNIIEQIQAFYKEHGRTPQASDFDTNEKLENHSAVRHIFGNLNEARRTAKVPELRQIAGRKWVEVYPEELVGKR